jgi:hypothetical protein
LIIFEIGFHFMPGRKPELQSPHLCFPCVAGMMCAHHCTQPLVEMESQTFFAGQLWTMILPITQIAGVSVLAITPSFFFSLDLDSSYKRKHVIFVFVSLAYFTKHYDLQFHWFSCKSHNLILLCGWIILHNVSIPHFLYPFICW